MKDKPKSSMGEGGGACGAGGKGQGVKADKEQKRKLPVKACVLKHLCLMTPLVQKTSLLVYTRP